jgi:hypothetical protein
MIGSIERVIRAHTTSDDASEGSVLSFQYAKVLASPWHNMLDAIADDVAYC